MKKFPLNFHVDVDRFIPATEEEKEYMVKMRPSTTFFKDGVKRLLKNKVATFSLIIIVIVTLTSIIVPMFWPYGYEEALGVVKGQVPDPTFNYLAPFEYIVKIFIRFSFINVRKLIQRKFGIIII